jgi:anti-anti-sigma factor
MTVQTEQIGLRYFLVNLAGPLNESQYQALTGTFEALKGRGAQGVVVSLKHVPFIDSRGVAALVAGYKLFGRRSQNFRLAHLPDQPRLVFELTGFDRIFEIYDTVAQAAAPDTGLTLNWSPLPVRLPAMLAA